MAIDNPTARFLLGAKAFGVDFSSTLSLGRQWLSADADELTKAMRVAGAAESVDRALGGRPWADDFWQALGVRSLASLDASSYQGATLVHDLNDPIPRRWHGRFDVVHDGGTLEHVFHFPNAVRNAMQLVRVGGYFTQVCVANNYLGHGFYQFSPEVLFRVFSRENGFRTCYLLMHERTPGGRWFSVQDPQSFGARVQLRNRRHTYIFLVARRVAERPIFSAWPQQSDYLREWNGDPPADEPPRREGDTWFARCKRLLPAPVKTAVKRALRFEPDASFSEACYRPLSEDDVTCGRIAGAITADASEREFAPPKFVNFAA